jgi:Zn-dependent protease with chaperone function
MRAAKGPQQDPAIITRLQSQAARNPRAFRLHLTLLAVAGDAALTATTVLPLAAPIAFGALFYNVELFYWAGAAAIVFFAWVLRPTFELEGRELRGEEAPTLLADIAALKKRLGVSRRIRVRLDDSLNAAAVESRGLFGLLGTQCTLLLGVPLLVALSREQMLAVIAHELGHLSRRHGLLGHWLYRARVGWIEYTQFVTESDSPFDRAAAWYARRFLTHFSPRSFVHSRQCEYEADGDAAVAVGADRIAEALSRIAVLATLWEQHFPRAVARWKLKSADPPGDYYERFGTHVAEVPLAHLEAWLAASMRAPSSWLDTHPSLAERLRALGQQATLAAPTSSAGLAFFGNSWGTLLAEFNDAWLRSARPDWLLEHLWLVHVAHPLLAAAADAAKGFDAALQLTRARALRTTDPEAGLPALRDLHLAHPEFGLGKFAYASALLTDNDVAGAPMMEEVAREHLALRVRAFECLAAFHARNGNDDIAEQWETWLRKAAAMQSDVVSKVVSDAERGRAQASPLRGGERAALAEATRMDRCVVNAWLLEDHAEMRFVSSRPAVRVTVPLLVLNVDFQESARLGQQESEIADRYRQFMRRLFPADHVPTVLTYFTTETLPASLSELSDPTLRLGASAHAAGR